MTWSGISWAAAVLVVTLTGAQENDTGPGNRAHIDVAATEEVRDAAVTISETLFTYSYTDLETHEAEVADLATDEFAREHPELLDLSHAEAEQTSLTSEAGDAAVRVLRNDHAEVMVFLDQESTSAGAGQRTHLAGFTMTLQHVDGDWRVADIDMYGAA